MEESVFKRRAKPTVTSPDVYGAKIIELTKKIAQLEQELNAQRINHNKVIKQMKYMDDKIRITENNINIVSNTISTMKQTISKLAGIFR